MTQNLRNTFVQNQKLKLEGEGVEEIETRKERSHKRKCSSGDARRLGIHKSQHRGSVQETFTG